jgi:hypothetical protein
MKKSVNYKIASIAMALPFQLLVVLLGADYGGAYLNKNYTQSFDWKAPLLLAGFFMLFYTGYKMFEVVKKDMMSDDG